MGDNVLEELYLDLDGVFVNFTLGIARAFDVLYSVENYPFTKNEWDIFKEMGRTWEEANALCDEEFWCALPWLPDGRSLYKAIRQQYAHIPTFLLTCPMGNSGSWTGKYRWVKENMPDLASNLIVTPVPKEKLVRHKGQMLVDDRQTAVDAVNETKAFAVLVPRPWNRDHKYSALHVCERVTLGRMAYGGLLV